MGEGGGGLNQVYDTCISSFKSPPKTKQQEIFTFM